MWMSADQAALVAILRRVRGAPDGSENAVDGADIRDLESELAVCEMLAAEENATPAERTQRSEMAAEIRGILQYADRAPKEGPKAG